MFNPNYTGGLIPVANLSYIAIILYIKAIPPNRVFSWLVE
jgi:hypothetical protein